MAAALSIFALATQAAALSLEDCDRTTHISHGGETDHVDYGEGRVGYAEWWSQEGVSRDLVVVECASGRSLRVRTHEERITDRLIPDRTRKASGIISEELRGSAALFSFERLATRLKPVGEDIEIAALTAEPCGCAALYPGLRGEKSAFEGGQ
ncbi:MAG: hypothetical protein AAF566_03690 [Pseudomonadota bacterium]